jgi:hypothetical protein
MTKTLTKEGMEERVERDFDKPEGLELGIIPKKKFLGWYTYIRGQIEEIEMNRAENGAVYMECPDCRVKMESYYIESPNGSGLWHLCPKCELSFSHRQYQYFRHMFLRLIEE